GPDHTDALLRLEGSVPRAAWPSGAHLSRPFSAAAPGSHLCAQYRSLPTRCAGVQALDASVRSRAAGGGACCMNINWTSGNALELLENGEAFFPAAFEAIRKAESSVVLETFIIFEDKVG